MKMETYPDQDMMAIDVANILAGEIEGALFHEDTVSFAVPGGSTPGPIFDALCAADLDWSRVRVLLTDERWVPEDHDRSNTALVRSRLLKGRAAKAQFVPFFLNDMTPLEAAPEISSGLADILPITVLLLGMGDDMHTASLFPNMAELDSHMAPDAPTVVAVAPDSQPDERVSLSGPVLDGAMSKHLVITGEAKRHALEMAMTLPAVEAPIGSVMSGGTVHWAP